MKSFKVTALSQKGKDSIKKNYLERDNMKNLEKVLFKKVFDVIVTADFRSIEFKGKSAATSYIDSQSMMDTLSNSMVELGCVKGEDFEVEVINFE